MILIAGGDSQIGRGAAAELSAAGAVWKATTRRGTEGCLPLDLLQDPGAWRPPAADAALLCAGVTGLQACEDDPAGSSLVNVDRMAALARILAAQGTFVVFLSTNLVFDGEEVMPGAAAPRRPVCEYGRQKARAEDAVAAAAQGRCAVVRLTKVVGRDVPLVDRWKADLRGGAEVRAYADLPMAPIALGWAVSALLAITRAARPGTYHLSASSEITYADVARVLAEHCGMPASRVKEVSAREDGHPCVPQHAALAMGAAEADLGLEAPDPWTAWRGCFAA